MSLVARKKKWKFSAGSIHFCGVKELRLCIDKVRVVFLVMKTFFDVGSGGRDEGQLDEGAFRGGACLLV